MRLKAIFVTLAVAVTIALVARSCLRVPGAKKVDYDVDSRAARDAPDDMAEEFQQPSRLAEPARVELQTSESNDQPSESSEVAELNDRVAELERQIEFLQGRVSELEWGNSLLRRLAGDQLVPRLAGTREFEDLDDPSQRFSREDLKSALKAFLYRCPMELNGPEISRVAIAYAQYKSDLLELNKVHMAALQKEAETYEPGQRSEAAENRKLALASLNLRLREVLEQTVGIDRARLWD